MRYNLMWGVTDLEMNVMLMFLGKATQVSLSVLPMNIIMMEVIPDNIEASMFAIVGAIIAVSSEWLGEIVGGIVCDYYNITTENKNNFHLAIRYKMYTILLSILLIGILPTKQELRNLKA